MDFLLSYILSQNKITGKIITSTKIENIADNFLHIFSNFDDPYLHTLKLMKEEDYLNFAKQENKEFGPNNYIKQDFQGFANNLKTLINNLTYGGYLHRDAQLLRDIEEILDSVNSKLNYIKASQNNESRNFMNQRLLFMSGFPAILFNLMANLMKFSEILKAKEGENILMKFKAFLEYYLKGNKEVQSSFFRKQMFCEIEKMFLKFPTIISNLLLDIFKDDAQILISKDYTLDILMNMLINHNDSLQKNAKIQDYSDLSRIIDIIAIFIDLNCYKIFNWIPEYDLRIAQKLIEFTDFFEINELEALLQGYEADKKKK